MIGEQSKVKQFCNSDIRLIENYDKTTNSDIWYVCHYKLGIELDKSSNELENYSSEGWNRGYGRPSWNSKKNISNII